MSDRCGLLQAHDRNRQRPPVQDAAASNEIADTAIETFDLGAYIGAKVVVDDDIYGTICFADGAERDSSLTEQETYFVELFARLIGHALERRTYERALDEREEIYRAVIDSSFDLVFRIEPDGTFSYLSDGVEALLGVPPEAYLHEPFTSMLPNEETIELAGDIFERVMRGERVEEYYFPLSDDSGSRVFVDIRVVPLYASDVPTADRQPADIVGIQGMARSAADRHRRESLIRVLNRVLRHNLRNEMNVIRGFAEILEAQLAEDAADYAGRIITASERLTDLSETARRLEENFDQPQERGAIDVVPIVSQVGSALEERYPSVSVEVETPEEAITEAAPRVEAALWELTDNAAKHSGDAPTVEITVTTERASVVIDVQDDGPGLPAQEQSVLVDGDESPLVHGSGLGLYMVFWISQSLGGTLQTEVNESGTAVELRLPRHKPT